jgi:hypothetical protein
VEVDVSFVSSVAFEEGSQKQEKKIIFLLLLLVFFSVVLRQLIGYGGEGCNLFVLFLLISFVSLDGFLFFSCCSCSVGN